MFDWGCTIFDRTNLRICRHYHTSPYTTYNSNSRGAGGQGLETDTPLVYEWGEHEIDYMMFLRIDDKGYLKDFLKGSNRGSDKDSNQAVKGSDKDSSSHPPLLQLNPEEVQSIRYVSLPELQDMMKTPGLKWSPWFALIVRDLLATWWQDLDATMTTDKHVNLTHIHRLF